MALATVAGLGATGCSPRASQPCRPESQLVFRAMPDSLGLEAFLALPPAEQQRRRDAAERRASEGAATGRPDLELAALIDGAGLAPDDPGLWLAQARIWRWLGDDLRTGSCLENAAAAVRAWNPQSPLGRRRGSGYRAEAALEVALLQAWLHYDRGEWSDALDWVRTAQRAEAGSTALLRLQGLLEATCGRPGLAEEIAAGLQRKNAFTTDAAWIRSRLETAQGRFRGAYNYVYDLRPDQPHAAECYRDMGRAAERVADWSSARKWYRESVAALPLADRSCLRPVSRPRVSDTAGRHPLPFWLAFDRYYVTGSLSAYLAYAYERFAAAATADDREAWGGLAVNAAGICLRLDMESAAVRRLRGLVFAGTGRTELALGDLTAALPGFPAGAAENQDLEARIGHLLLLQKDHVAALGYLRRALAAAPDDARAWSDLGLAQVMAGDPTAAAEAFGRALALDENLTEAWYNRGLMHLHAGDLAEAERDLGRAAALAPDNQEIAGLLQQVARNKRASPPR